MFKKKELSAAQIEAVETKDFFDRIVPGMIKFYTDHYICGNFYKSCWAVTEYPPNTEETAILAHLADRNGVTLRIYNRLVTSMEQRKDRAAGYAQEPYDDHHKRCQRKHQGSGQYQ